MLKSLDDLALDKALKKMSAKELALLAYKTTAIHVQSCQESSDRVYKILRWVGGLVVALVIEKAGEVLHLPHLSTLMGGS